MPTSDDIEGALTGVFSTLATAQSWPVEWPNRLLDPPVGSIWMRATNMLGSVEAAAIGSDAPNLYYGIYQVSVFVPRSTGTLTARAAAQLILGAFPRAGVASHNGAQVRFEKSYALPGTVEDEYYHLPVRVEWRAEV